MNNKIKNRNIPRVHEEGEIKFIVTQKKSLIINTKRGTLFEVVPIDGLYTLERESTNVSLHVSERRENPSTGELQCEILSIHVNGVDSDTKEKIHSEYKLTTPKGLSITAIEMEGEHHVGKEYSTVARKSILRNLHEMEEDEIATLFHAKRIDNVIHVYDTFREITEIEQKQINDYLIGGGIPPLYNEVDRFIPWKTFINKCRSYVNDIVNSEGDYTANDSVLYGHFTRIDDLKEVVKDTNEGVL